MQERTMKVPATAIHIEDEENWGDEIRRYIEKQNELVFDRYICTNELNIIENFRSDPKPIILFVDLGLQQTKNFSGYDWLVNHLGDFREHHTNSAVFVISGFLNDPIINSLVQRGIPRENIYKKGTWSKKRTQFITTLKSLVEDMDNLALENIMQGRAGKNIDAYLTHLFRNVKQKVFNVEVTEKSENEAATLPMLIRSSSEDWNYSEIPDLTVTTRLGKIFCATGSSRSLLALEADQAVISVEASRPASEWDCQASVPFVKGDIICNHHAEEGDQVILAFIDTGIDIFHKAFLDDTGTKIRILAIWNQKDNSGSPPEEFNRGTEYTQDQINDIISGKQPLPWGLKVKENDHGTHVISIAAGKRTSHFSGGIAPQAKILVVIPAMEVQPNNPYSTGYSVSHVEALSYIANFARKVNLPVVINVSAGMNAGAHDGSSILEAAFDTITDMGRSPGIVVVKSAGNQRDKNGHARIQVHSNSVTDLKWICQSDTTKSDVLELWFDPSDQIEFVLIDPHGEESQNIGVDSSILATFPSGNEYELKFRKWHNDNGASQLFIAITAGNRQSIVKGTWTLRIYSRQVMSREGYIDAWIERNDYHSTVFLNYTDLRSTLSIPGTAHTVITVGAIHTVFPFKDCEFSSQGPTRDNREKPELCAPGYQINAASSLQGEETRFSSGTSMAAPHVSGAIALALSKSKKLKAMNNSEYPNARQIVAALTRSVPYYSARWHPAMGYGPLDIENFFSCLGIPKK